MLIVLYEKGLLYTKSNMQSSLFGQKTCERVSQVNKEGEGKIEEEKGEKRKGKREEGRGKVRKGKKEGKEVKGRKRDENTQT